MNKKVEKLGYVLLVLLWFLGSQLIVGNVTALIVGAQQYQAFYNTYQYELNFIAQALCLSVILVIDYRYKKLLVKTWQLSVKEVVRYIGLGIGLYLLSVMINMLLLPYFPDYVEIQNMFKDQSSIWRFIVIVVMAPVVEEYVFRGKIQGYLKEVFPITLAIVCQALLFGSMHALALQKIYASVIGILLGIAREKSGKLQSSIMMHMTVNFISWYIATMHI